MAGKGKVKNNIPVDIHNRNEILGKVRQYARDESLTPPLSRQGLMQHTERVREKYNIDAQHLDFLTVLLNNAVWESTVGSIPYQKRLLLLPRCLRHVTKCQAIFDEYGLLCQHCGECDISSLQKAAEKLGYAVLVAEGSPAVLSLIESGQITAVVGVSCLSVLDEVFELINAAAVPAIAIPLLADGCVSTSVDADWVWDTIYLSNDKGSQVPDLDNIRCRVNKLFSNKSLSDALDYDDDQTQRIAFDWLGESGKRWRPFLTVAIYSALSNHNGDDYSIPLQKTVVAVECFHKASLIHDDIEDDDPIRYNQPTLHEKHGLPIALNTGDLLLGDGYRLIGECDVDAEIKARLLNIVAGGHRTLCLGQGAELCWQSDKRPLSSSQVLDIFRLKTSPAFMVALQVGAVMANSDNGMLNILEAYSNNLGIAYQIKDDLEDFTDVDRVIPAETQPTIIWALAFEIANENEKELLKSLWRRQLPTDSGNEGLTILMKKAIEKAIGLRDNYKNEAIKSLESVSDLKVKILLRRVIAKIFDLS